jgi:Protein of unknown function (DUF3106)
LAEDLGRRLIRNVLFRNVLPGFALATILAAGAVAQPVAIRSLAWTDLSPSERQILAPLGPPEWERLEPARRQKWRGLAQRYPAMTPDAQQKIQHQMRTWASLSPQERQAARERYKTLKALPPEKKQEVQQKWEQYQNLPPETKRELAAKPLPADAAAGAPTGAKHAIKPAAPPPALPSTQSAPAGNTSPK